LTTAFGVRVLKRKLVGVFHKNSPPVEQKYLRIFYEVWQGFFEELAKFCDLVQVPALRRAVIETTICPL
jgi:hypothetical protein